MPTSSFELYDWDMEQIWSFIEENSTGEVQCAVQTWVSSCIQELSTREKYDWKSLITLGVEYNVALHSGDTVDAYRLEFTAAPIDDVIAGRITDEQAAGEMEVFRFYLEKSGDGAILDIIHQVKPH